MRNMKFLLMTLAAAFTLALSTPARAQEPGLVNEIVARVNNDIITRADYLSAIEAFKEELKRQMQNKSEAEFNAEYERLKSGVLDYMIDDMLLEQKAKELGLDVEAEVNQQMLQIAKDSNLKGVAELEQAMKSQGMDPESARSTVRKRIQQQIVMQREVLQPIFSRMTEKERRDFYEKHKEAFTTPGEVTLSEIFLPLEGHTAAEVEQRARRLVAELRAGQSFVEAVKINSPANRATRGQDGKMGAFKAGDLNPDITAAISTLKVGEVTEPIRQQDGFQIIRVDDRKAATVRPFEDPEVQRQVGSAATMEQAEDARKKYLKKLREDAFVDIAKGYASTQAKVDKK
jgi:parvulin-like peptidyl-prolyl isomerase